MPRQDLVLVDVGKSNLASLPCCGVKNPLHVGRVAKNCWLAGQFSKGVRAKVLLAPQMRQCGYIEYLPGEHAWRGVNAAGYMFIHCIWTFYKQYQHRGEAARMIEASVEDARAAGMKGVAVVAREGPWLAGPAVFLANGFHTVATAPPDYLLLVRKLDPDAADPSFRDGWHKKAAKYGNGLTIIRSAQCPHGIKFAGEITEAARGEFGLEPRIVELKTPRQAQNAPTPYAVFSILYNGRVVADHPISRTRFRNIMRKLSRADVQVCASPARRATSRSNKG
jgi:hypothetical protein